MPVLLASLALASCSSQGDTEPDDKGDITPSATPYGESTDVGDGDSDGGR